MISTTTLQNLISIIAAIVSSSGRSSVGPKHTPRLDMVIKFLSAFPATLCKRGGLRGEMCMLENFYSMYLLFKVSNHNVQHFEMVFGQFMNKCVNMGSSMMS